MRVSMTALALLAGAAVAHGATAEELCVKVPRPACMDDQTTFVSADKMTDCQAAVKDYIDYTMAYIQCVNRESTTTGEELTTSVERFNCRLSGACR